VRLGDGFPLERGHESGVPPVKRRYYAVIGSYSVKMVAVRYRLAANHNNHWWRAFQICQHQWPWTTLNLQKRGFGEFFWQFLTAAHISTVNCDEMARDRPKQFACEIFSIERRF